MLGLTTKTYSLEHGKRSHQKMNNRHIKPVRTHVSHTHDSSPSGNSTPPTASALVQPVLKGLDIEPSERLVKGLGVPWSGPILNVAEAEAAAQAAT